MVKLNRRGRIIQALMEGHTLKCNDFWYVKRLEKDKYVVSCEDNCCEDVISLEELFDMYIDDGYNWVYHVE